MLTCYFLMGWIGVNHLVHTHLISKDIPFQIDNFTHPSLWMQATSYVH